MQQQLRESATEAYPLSSGQKLRWAATPSRAIAGIRISGNFDPSRMEAAWRNLVESEEILRLCFAHDPTVGYATQSIGEHGRLEWKSGNWSTLDAIEFARQREVALERHARPGKVDCPELRVDFMLCPDASALMIVSASAMACDAATLMLLAERCCENINANDADVDRQEPISFVDYADWQEQLLTSRGTADDYWATALRIPAVTLPLERAADASPERRRIPIDVPDDLVTASTGGPAWFLTCWLVTLQRATGPGPIAICLDSSGRSDLRLSGIAGPLSTPLPLAVEIHSQMTFAEALSATGKAVGEAERNAIYLDTVSPGMLALLFGFAHRLLPPVTGRGYLLETIFLHEDVVQTKIRLVVESRGTDLAAYVDYDPARILECVAAALAEGVREAIKAASTRSPHSICRWDLWPTLLSQTAPSAFSLPTVNDLFERQSLKTPGRIAVQMGDLRLTYRELRCRTNAIAAQLVALGAGPEKTVLLLADRSVEFVAGLISILKAGAAYAPLNPDDPPQRHRMQAMLLRPAVILCTPEFEPRARAIDSVPVVLLTVAGEQSPNPPPVVPQPDNLACILFTSGSTGAAKAVSITHRGLSTYLAAITGQFGLQPASSGEALTFLYVSSIAADLGNTCLFPALLTGGRLILASQTEAGDPLQFIACLRDNAVDVLKIVPSHWEALTSAGGSPPAPRRFLVFGGATLRPELAKRSVSACQVFNHYGPTEATVGTTVFPFGLEGLSAVSGSVPIGSPLAGYAAYLLDEEMLGVLPGAAGEIYIGGAGLARGYAGNPRATASLFVPDPCGAAPGARLYRTGDLARRLPDGSLQHLGRIDTQIKIRGYRVETTEIEHAVSRMAGVRDCIVLTRQETDGGELVAYVSGDLSRVQEGAVTAHLREYLPEYMVPSAIVCFETLPLNANGKVDRSALPPVPARAHAALEEPRSALETDLTSLWCEVLRIRSAGPHEDFFQSGGHSLLATQLVSRVHEAFGVALPLAIFFERPTIAGLAEAVELLNREKHGVVTPPLEPASRTRDLPLSFAQQRLWTLHQLAPQSPVYNSSVAVYIDGDLNVTALRIAIAALVSRHEIFRTSFEDRAGQAFQRIAARLTVPSPIVNLEDASALDRDAILTTLAAVDAARPFDLAHAPLFRLLLVHLAPRRHFVQITLHHIITDAWSMGIMISELDELYGSIERGTKPALPPLRLQYADFAVWQRELLDGGRLDRQVEYWKRQLAGAPALLELPADRPRPAIQSFEGSTYRWTLDAALSNALRQTGRREGVTLFMVLMAAYQTFLHRICGVADILVGTAIANRHYAGVERIAGFFANHVVFRLDFSKLTSFHDVLQEIRRVTLEAYANQDTPFERLVDELQPERNLDRNPIYQANFAFLNAGRESWQSPNLRMQPARAQSSTSRFDLSLLLSEDGDRIGAAFEYSSGLFDQSTIARMAEHLTLLMSSCCGDPGRRLAEHSLQTAEAEGQCLERSRGLPASSRPFESIAECIATKRAGDASFVSIFDGHLETPRARMALEANRLANFLIDAGATPGSIVALCLPRTAGFAIAALAVWKAGCAWTPLDPNAPPARLESILEACGARIVITEDSIAESLPAAPGQLVVSLDGDRTQIQKSAETAPDVMVQPDSLAYVFHTSGSLGKPKGVMVTHGSLWHSMEARRLYYPGRVRRFLVASQFHFDSSIPGLFWTLLDGGEVVMAPDPRDLAGIARLIRERGVTHILMLPTLYEGLLEETGGQGLESLEVAIVAGEAVWGGLVEKHRRVSSWNETVQRIWAHRGTVWCSVYDCAGWERGLRVPIGRPVPGARLYVLDAEMQAAPVGMAGELYLGGEIVARGYLGDPALTAERFVPDLWEGSGGARLYRTGDRARYRADGEIEYLGRRDEQVKIRGVRIEPGEIEAVLREHSGVSACAAVVTGEGPAARLVAWVSGGGASDERALMQWLRERLPDYMTPQAVHWMESLPVTSTGKIDKRALARLNRNREKLEGDARLPETGVEAALLAVWRQTLGRQDIGVDDNFFDIGGDSILSIQVAIRARPLGIRITSQQIFQYQTIAELAVAAAATLSEEEIDSPPGGEPFPLTPIQRWFLDDDPVNPHHFTQPLLLAVRDGDWDRLRRAIEEVAQRHDALRLRFRPTTDPDQPCVQEYSEESPGRVTLIDLSAVPESGRTVLLETAAARIQHSLNVESGPVFRASAFRLAPDEKMRLLLTAHHLVTDAVSWRILLQDLEFTYIDAGSVSAKQTPERTTSYRRWAEHLYAESLRLTPADFSEISALGPESATLPCDRQMGTNSTESAGQETADLSIGDTARLLALASGARVDEILLASFAGALAEWTGLEDLWIDIEDHGRSDLPAGFDLTNTVGWFTAVVPVQVNGAGGAFQNLLKARHALRDIGVRARRYGIARYLAPHTPETRILRGRMQPEVGFNYLGHFDASLGEDSLFGIAPERPGPSRSPAASRPHVLEVTGGILDRRLRLAVSYSRNLHRPDTITRFLDRCLHWMLLTIETVENAGLPEVSVSLSEHEWEQIVANASYSRP